VTSRALLFLVAGLFIASLCREATAQTTTNVVLSPTVTRRDGREPQGIKPSVINLADCDADDKVGFKINPISTANLTLEVWAGTTAECGNKAHNSTLDGSQCWQLLVFTPPPSSAFDIPVRKILPHGEGADTICATTAADGTGSGNVSVYFVPVAGNTQSGTTATYAMTFDLKGPPAPTGFTLGIGDTRLIPTWTATNSTDISSYRLYCQPSDTCTSDFLLPGQIPSTDEPDDVKTGTSSPISTQGEVEGLENGQQYICAMAGYDPLYNLGVLSETDCETPKPVDGYYKTYRAAGGTAGGGYCSFGRLPNNPGLVPVLFGALGLLVARRCRRRR